MRVLLLGAYGLIGAELARRLAQDGHEVIGLGRSRRAARRVPSVSRWIYADLRSLTEKNAWRFHLSRVEVVINAAGALQDGAKDDLSAVQDRSIRALIDACEQQESVRRFVQISAPGATADAETPFMRTKFVADEALKASNLDWVVFRPGLVISANAYGGTQLLRMLAAFPVVQPLTYGGRDLQTVAVSDVCDAVSRAVSGEAPSGDYDLVEPYAPRLRDIVLGLRAWLGYSAPLAVIEAPAWMAAPASWLADLAGWLGWRSPLRSTAMRVIANNVVGDPAPWRGVTGRDLKPLAHTLSDMPATAQERLYARAQLALPIVMLTLAAFWFASGLIGYAHVAAATTVLSGAIPYEAARTFVIGGSLLDMLLGVAVLFRRWSKAALIGMLVMTAGYVGASIVFTPHLWGDPMGPMVKAIPAAVLAFVALALLEER